MAPMDFEVLCTNWHLQAVFYENRRHLRFQIPNTSPEVYINISSVVEFQRWWVLKSKIFGQESTSLKEKNLSMNVSSSKTGHDFSNKVVQKLTL